MALNGLLCIGYLCQQLYKDVPSHFTKGCIEKRKKKHNNIDLSRGHTGSLTFLHTTQAIQSSLCQHSFTAFTVSLFKSLGHALGFLVSLTNTLHTFCNIYVDYVRSL